MLAPVTSLIQFFLAHWYSIALTVYAIVTFLASAIANSLPAPTATDTKKYVFWFRFVNYCAQNATRAKNLARVEDSPNFIPAAEAYMKKKLEQQNGVKQ